MQSDRRARNPVSIRRAAASAANLRPGMPRRDQFDSDQAAAYSRAVDQPMSAAASSDSPLLPFLEPTRGRIQFTIEPRPSLPRPHVAGLLAGAAEVDITPPPGLPKAGYSANANDGTGFRTRLRARILHLRNGTTSLAIVQLDLLGGSGLLQHLVAQAIADDTDVPLAGLFIGATHTHAGPGQFLGTDFYNRFASNRTGFDPAWTQWLVDRIAAGVRTAVASRQPARLAFGSTEVWGLTRNRSLPPHVRNAEIEDRRTEPQRKYVHINPRLHLCRVDTAGRQPEALAAMVVFSVHGTGISMRSKEYNADLWAYLVGELAHRIESRHGVRPVVGAIEGTHADVAPALRPGMAGHVEAARVGRGIGAEAAALYESLEARLSSDVPLAAGLREVNLEESRSIDGFTLPQRPAVGAALVAGAHENVTPVIHRIPPFRAGMPKPWPTSHPQGAKWVLGTRWLQPLVLPLRGFPRVLPIHVLRIGASALVGLPFEVTVASGRRIAAAVESATREFGVDEAIVSSVANEYCGYVATAEEYALQHYEGGHTLYGPATQPFLAAHARALAAATVADDSGTVAELCRIRTFDLRVRRFLPRRSTNSSNTPTREFLARAQFHDATQRTDSLWEILWRDVAPGDLDWHEPLARVEVCRNRNGPAPQWNQAHSRDGRRIDDQGWDIEVEHLGPCRDGEGHRYAARWHDPIPRAGECYRFVLPANAGRPELTSDAFD